jgi:hypothetical protein
MEEIISFRIAYYAILSIKKQTKMFYKISSFYAIDLFSFDIELLFILEIGYEVIISKILRSSSWLD